MGSIMTWSTKKTILMVALLIVIIVVAVEIPNIAEDVATEKIIINQVPVTGQLDFWTTPGMKAQWFGHTTEYFKTFQVWFTDNEDQGERGIDQSLPIIFNDAGKGWVSGSARILMPQDEVHLRLIKNDFGSQRRLIEELIRPTIAKAVFFTGPLLSSYESYAVKKNDCIYYITDQLENGIYQTISKETKVIDDLSGKEKIVTLATRVTSSDPLDFQWARQEEAPFQRYGLKTILQIDKIKYDSTITKQIAAQQEKFMEVQTAIADAKAAEQRAIKAEAEGKASAMQAKWDQEKIKATEVTKAEQQRDVAKLEKEAAEYTKQQNILLGDGEAYRKRKNMESDGALQPKIDAWIEVNSKYADAISKYQGNWVPGVVMGADGKAGSAGGAQQLIDMLMAKTAKELALEFEFEGKTVKK